MLGVVVSLSVFVYVSIVRLEENVDGFHEETRDIRERLAVLETKFEFRTAQQLFTLNREINFRNYDQE